MLRTTGVASRDNVKEERKRKIKEYMGKTFAAD
jgi:hypothetical protein